MPQPRTPVQEWPELATPGWTETAATLHLWTQMVGKTRLALAPWQNHWWHVPLYVTSRGLSTSLMHQGGRGLELEFDFLTHRLEGRSTDGRGSSIPLAPRAVADFYREYRALLAELGVSCRIWSQPVEIAGAVPFEQDTRHASYDADWAQRLWRVLVSAHRVLHEFRARFIGKVSPVHFFWGSFDLAVTRFSGRRAPPHPGGMPHMGDWVAQAAYSHEVSSAGFWPGSPAAPEAVFYAYAYPEPRGFDQAHVSPASAHYQRGLGEFVLPYVEVRSSGHPDRALLAFLESTYRAAADLAHWDRGELECEPPRPPPPQHVQH